MLQDQYGKKLKEWRLQHGLNQRYVAERLNVTQATVSRWERGVDGPSQSHVRRLKGLLHQAEVNTCLQIERIGIAGLTSARAIFATDGLELMAWSNGFEKLWPKNHVGKTLESITDRYLIDDVVGEAANLLHDPETQYHLAANHVVAMSCVTQRSTRFEDHHAFTYRMHGVVRRLGARQVIDVTYEPMSSKQPTLCEPIVFRP